MCELSIFSFFHISALFSLKSIEGKPLKGTYPRESIHPISDPLTMQKWFPSYRIVAQRIKNKTKTNPRMRLQVKILEKKNAERWVDFDYLLKNKRIK